MQSKCDARQENCRATSATPCLPAASPIIFSAHSQVSGQRLPTALDHACWVSSQIWSGALDELLFLSSLHWPLLCSAIWPWRKDLVDLVPYRSTLLHIGGIALLRSQSLFLLRISLMLPSEVPSKECVSRSPPEDRGRRRECVRALGLRPACSYPASAGLLCPGISPCPRGSASPLIT